MGKKIKTAQTLADLIATAESTKEAFQNMEPVYGRTDRPTLVPVDSPLDTIRDAYDGKIDSMDDDQLRIVQEAMGTHISRKYGSHVLEQFLVPETLCRIFLGIDGVGEKSQAEYEADIQTVTQLMGEFENLQEMGSLSIEQLELRHERLQQEIPDVNMDYALNYILNLGLLKGRFEKPNDDQLLKPENYLRGVRLEDCHRMFKHPEYGSLVDIDDNVQLTLVGHLREALEIADTGGDQRRNTEEYSPLDRFRKIAAYLQTYHQDKRDVAEEFLGQIMWEGVDLLKDFSEERPFGFEYIRQLRKATTDSMVNVAKFVSIPENETVKREVAEFILHSKYHLARMFEQTGVYLLEGGLYQDSNDDHFIIAELQPELYSSQQIPWNSKGVIIRLPKGSTVESHANDSASEEILPHLVAVGDKGQVELVKNQFMATTREYCMEKIDVLKKEVLRDGTWFEDTLDSVKRGFKYWVVPSTAYLGLMVQPKWDLDWFSLGLATVLEAAVVVYSISAGTEQRQLEKNQDALKIDYRLKPAELDGADTIQVFTLGDKGFIPRYYGDRVKKS